MIGLNRAEHAITGAFVGLATYGLHKLGKNEAPTIQGTIGSLLLGGFAGTLPDLLEPATSPNHRSFFHSAVFLIMLLNGNRKVWESQDLTEDQKLVISVFSAAYGSHLVSDSRTAKNLPFLVQVK